MPLPARRPLRCAGPLAGLLLATVCGAPGVLAQEARQAANLYGAPGLVDLPTAEMQPDGQLTFNIANVANATRNTLNFQIAPRLSGSFRYTATKDFGGPGGENFDRSFDLRFLLIAETATRPAFAIGINDIVGTGQFGSEYIVATKRLTPALTVSGGIGWGRLGSYNGFSNPLGALDSRFDTRPGTANATGGKISANTWFRGDAAFFGGLRWTATDRLSFALEYSSDAYVREQSDGRIDHRSPVSIGLTYRIRPNLDLAAAYLHGDAAAVQLTYSFNPKSPPRGPTVDPAPQPVRPRGDPGWPSLPQDRLAASLRAEGITLDRITVDGATATVLIRNGRYPAAPQAIGRTARVLTAHLPPAVEAFVIVPVVQGMATSAVTLQRRDLEELEHAPDAAWQSYVRADIADAVATPRQPGPPPRFEWSLGPYVATELFDPDDPIRADIGLRARAEYEPAPGFVLSGSVRKRAFGSLDNSTRLSTSVLPHVRSDNAIYNREGDPALEYLTAEAFFRPAEAVYGRLTAGYLESMFGGVSAELLWQPVGWRAAYGVEINYARQRDYDQLLGFQDYDVLTGHVSAYFPLASDYQLQIDVGRYLAGDWGATLALHREFENGWRIGAFATKTEVSSADFGEGAFDKGIQITVPMGWFNGTASRQDRTGTIRPVLRDGGARLNVRNRLHDLVREYQDPDLRDQWGRFWQ